jgi:hypothetical protein
LEHGHFDVVAKDIRYLPLSIGNNIRYFLPVYR